ncbi:hypothetical protein E2562_005939 [Oryza meyeriana var. granulata]|uniref:Uncharacterized protein n=1 Tax=Oryza meyeriana var. granulata TaxID=110450 RepID=A0A6G1DUZ4_9ORYZ|nr:hypothetical protein E2562_005939 [Oryza meyeriana var. granulata]
MPNPSKHKLSCCRRAPSSCPALKYPAIMALYATTSGSHVASTRGASAVRPDAQSFLTSASHVPPSSLGADSTSRRASSSSTRQTSARRRSPEKEEDDALWEMALGGAAATAEPAMRRRGLGAVVLSEGGGYGACDAEARPEGRGPGQGEGRNHPPTRIAPVSPLDAHQSPPTAAAFSLSSRHPQPPPPPAAAPPRAAACSHPLRRPDLLPPPPPARPPCVLAVVVLGGGIWLSHRAATTDCERFLERPVIALGVLLFVLSLTGLAGALCENWAKIRSYLQDDKVCEKLGARQETLNQFVNTNLSPAQGAAFDSPLLSSMCLE